MTNQDSIARLQAAWQAVSRQSLLPVVQEQLARSTGAAIPRTARIALAHLAERKAARVSELATAAGVDVSTMSRALRHLDEAGFVRRQPGEDLRAVLVSITAEGERAFSQLLGAVQQLLADALGHWSEPDRAQLADLMTRFAEDFSAHLNRTPTERVPQEVQHA